MGSRASRLKLRLASPWWALGVLAIGSTGSAGIAWVLEAHHRDEVDRIVGVELRHAADSFQEQMNGRTLVLERMAFRWARRGEMPRTEWESDARLVTQQITGFQAIIWIDPGARIRWMVPFRGNERAQDFDFSSEPGRRAALERARRSGKTTVSHVMRLLPGPLGFHILAPILREGQLLGFVGGVFHLDATVDAILHPLVRSPLQLEIWEDGHRVFGPHPGGEPPGEGASFRWREVPIQLGEVTWILRGRPLPEMIAELHSPLTGVALISGLLMSALAAFVTYLAQVARIRTRALTEVSALQEAVLQGIDYAVVSIDSKNRIRSFNAGAERIFGHRASEVVGQRAWDRLLDPAQPPPELEGLEAGIGEEAFEREWTFLRRNGQLFPARISVRAMLSSDGHAEGWVVVLQDLAARREEEAIRSMLSSFVASSDDAFIGTDLSLRIRSWNRGAEKIFGYSEAEVLGQPSTFLSPDQHRYESVQIGERLLRGESNVRYETVRRKKDGSLVEVAALASTVRGARGEPIGITVYMQDITVAKAAERELIRAKEAAEAATRSKSDFLARMSHEIRTPMNGVLGMIDLALRDASPAAQRDYLLTAQLSARQLLRLINDVLDFSKIEAQQLKLDHTPFRLHDCVAETLRNSSAKAHGKGLELLLEIEPKVPEHLVGDVHRVRQVLMNLLDNAVKFTDRGEVVVRISLCSDPASDPARIRFEVSDTGRGIAPDKRERVFGAFAQEDEATTRKYGGTGLGLSICSQLVGLMGGKLELESEVGKGSRFSFDLSLAVQSTGGAETARGPEKLSPNLRIAVISEKPRQEAALSQMLRESGARVVQPEAAEVLVLDIPVPAVGSPGGGTVETPRLSKALEMGLPSLLLKPSVGADTLSLKALGKRVERLKPCSRSELTSAVNELTGQVLSGLTLPSEARPDGTPVLRILLAEDNDINRKVVSGLLGLYGHQLVEVETGAAAVERAITQRFDLILMDVQMPEMDGLEATRRIRAWEAANGHKAPRLPIVALTAQALEGDADHCREAGMDGYLAKPIEPAALFSVLAGVSPAVASPRARTPDEDVSLEPALELDVFDEHQLLSRVEGDYELRSELVQLFLDRLPELEGQVVRAASSASAQQVKEAAHRIQGALVSISAKAAAQVAIAMERTAREAQGEDIGVRLASLQGELRRLERVLHQAKSRWLRA